jgi:hypothetical protein
MGIRGGRNRVKELRARKGRPKREEKKKATAVLQPHPRELAMNQVEVALEELRHGLAGMDLEEREHMRFLGYIDEIALAVEIEEHPFEKDPDNPGSLYCVRCGASETEHRA